MEKQGMLTRSRICLIVIWGMVFYLQIYLVFKPGSWLCNGDARLIEPPLIMSRGLTAEYLTPPAEVDSVESISKKLLLLEGSTHETDPGLVQNRKVIGVYAIFIAVYKHFLPGFISNIRQKFVPNYDKVFLIITDEKEICDSLSQQSGFQCVVKKRVGWPYETLNRWAYFKDFDTTGLDYIWFFNSNAQCVETITDEVISPFTAVVHDNYVNKPYDLNSFERRPVSHAFVPANRPYIYYGARLIGASTDNFIRMCDILEHNTRLDELSKFIAMWHDESHYNHYVNVVLDRKVMEIGTEYHVPEDMGDDYMPNRKIIYLDKKKHIPNLNTTKSSRWQDWLGGHPHVHPYFEVPHFRPNLYRRLNYDVAKGMSKTEMIKDFVANFGERRYFHETEVFAATFDAVRYARYYGLPNALEAKADYYGAGYWDDRYYFVKEGSEDYGVQTPTMVLADEPDPKEPFQGMFVPH